MKTTPLSPFAFPQFNFDRPASHLPVQYRLDGYVSVKNSLHHPDGVSNYLQNVILRDPDSGLSLAQSVKNYSRRAVSDEKLFSIFTGLVELDRLLMVNDRYKDLMPGVSLPHLLIGQTHHAVSILSEWCLVEGLSDADMLELGRYHDLYGELPRHQILERGYHPQSILQSLSCLTYRSPAFKKLSHEEQLLADHFIASVVMTGSITQTLRDLMIQDRRVLEAVRDELTGREMLSTAPYDEKYRLGRWHCLDSSAKPVYKSLFEKTARTLDDILKKGTEKTEYWNDPIYAEPALNDFYRDTLDPFDLEQQQRYFSARKKIEECDGGTYSRLKYFYETVAGVPYDGEWGFPGFSAYDRVVVRRFKENFPRLRFDDPAKAEDPFRYHHADAITDAIAESFVNGGKTVRLHYLGMEIFVRVKKNSGMQIAFRNSRIFTYTYMDTDLSHSTSQEPGEWFTIEDKTDFIVNDGNGSREIRFSVDPQRVRHQDRIPRNRKRPHEGNRDSGSSSEIYEKIRSEDYLESAFREFALSANATQRELKKVFRKKVSTLHPDNQKTGDAKAFKAMRELYVMICKEKGWRP